MEIRGREIHHSYCVYALMNRKNEIYVGYTANLGHRLNQHNNDMGAVATRNKGPWYLFFVEMFEAEADARSRESKIIGSFNNGTFLEQTYWSRATIREQFGIEGLDWDATLANK